MTRIALMSSIGIGSLGLTATAQIPPLHEIGLLPGDTAVSPAWQNQVGSAIARSGDRFLVVWTDSRSAGVSSAAETGMDIYGIRLDAQGNAIDPVPFVVCALPGWQQAPSVTWNGQNWLVAFYSQDPTEFYYQNNVRGVRVSPAGQVLDTTPLMLADNQQYASVGGTDGQWLVTFALYHPDGYGSYIAGQRLDNDGQFLDAAPVMLMDWAMLSIGNPVPTISGASGGEYLVAGGDWFSYSYKAHRIGFNGQPIGADFTPPSPYIGSSGAEYYIAFIDANNSLRGSRMSPSGTLLDPAGALLYNGPLSSGDVSVSHDGTNWFVCWGVSNQIRTARVSAAGTVLDPGGVLLPVGTPATQSTYSASIAGAAAGGALCSFYDYRRGSESDVYAIPVSAANVAGPERTVSTSTPNQRTPDFAQGPGGQIAVAYISEASTEDRILVHFLSPAGQAGGPIEVARVPAAAKPGIAFNGAVYLIVWNDTSVKARRMRPDGSFVDAAPIDVMPGFNVDVAALGNDFCVVASNLSLPNNPQYIDVSMRRLSGTTGALLDGAPVAIGGSYAYNARVHADGTRWIATWEAHPTHDDPQSSAQYSFISPDGSHTPEASVNSPFTSSGGQPDVATSGDHLLFVWRSNSLANANNFISGRVLSSDGSWATGLFTIAEASGRQMRPTVEWDGARFIVLWEDQRNQVSFFDERTEIYGARVSELGGVLDPAAFAVVRGTTGVAAPAILCRAGVSYVASARMATPPPLDSYRIGLTILGATPCPADFDGNGAVEPSDVAAFVATWFASLTQGTLAGDFDGNGVIEPADVAAFVYAWFGALTTGC